MSTAIGVDADLRLGGPPMRHRRRWRPSVSDVSAAAAVTRQHFRALSEAEGGDYAQAIYLNHEVR